VLHVRLILLYLITLMVFGVEDELRSFLFFFSFLPLLSPLCQYIQEPALGCGLDGRGFESRQGLGIFLITTASRPALVPTLPPIQWVPAALSLGVNRPGREADN
jgi:hypothetical protein